ncbi:MAG TPA: nuclear transport factor 2 family protein [Steroidobacteraceae bacterium]|nr:nuclear transport factor 2 family protein [Steroidobacteraceae bacterium]
MHRFTLSEISRLLDQKYRRGEVMFRDGDMRAAVHDLYTEDARYLTPGLKVLQGRAEILAFFEAIRTQIGEVTVHPLCLWGNPQGVVFQFCNTTRRAPGTGTISHAHYIASFVQSGDDWLCNMEVVAAGHIDAATLTDRAASSGG